MRRHDDRAGLIVTVGYAAAVILLSLLALVAAAARAAEGVGEGEPARAYEVPEGAPAEPDPPSDQDECPEQPESAAEVQYSVEATQLPQICRALADRLDRVRERGYWTTAELHQLREEFGDQGKDLKASREQLEALAESQCEPDCTVRVTATEPVPVVEGDRSAAEEMYGGEIVSAIERGSEGTSGALWFLIGVCVISPVAGILWHTVKRGTE